MLLSVVPSRKKLLISLAVLTCFCLYIMLTAPISLSDFRILPKKDNYKVLCHYIESKKSSLPDISDWSPKKGKSIFFHETSCSSFIRGKITIKSRQACAVESAARMNPDYDVYLLYVSPGDIVFENSESDRFLRELMAYPNVHLFHLDLKMYLRGSLVENLFTEGLMRQSLYAESHTSDVLRFLTLWKYGGIYLDLDVVVTRHLKDLGSDFAGAESDDTVNSAVMGFNNTGMGHEHVTSCLEDLRDNFKGNDWGWNGPGIITRFLQKHCETDTVSEMVGRTCKGFKVYSSSLFYAIPYGSWEWFFKSESMETVKNSTNNSYLIHLWNKLSFSTRIPLGEKGVPYLEIAKKYCPNIIKQCDTYF